MLGSVVLGGHVCWLWCSLGIGNDVTYTMSRLKTFIQNDKKKTEALKTTKDRSFFFSAKFSVIEDFGAFVVA